MNATRYLKRTATWPPVEYRLPDSIEQIERGRPCDQRTLFAPDDSRDGRLRRLLDNIGPHARRA
jgi:hypothetical protein